MRCTTSILLTFVLAATGSGAVGHLHRAQHAAHDDAHVHAAHAQVCASGHDHTDDATPQWAAAQEGSGHTDACQTCLDLHLRALSAAVSPAALRFADAACDVACDAAAQVLCSAPLLCIDTTGPPAASPSHF